MLMAQPHTNQCPSIRSKVRNNMAAPIPETKHLQVPKDGSVAVTAETDVTEQEISDDRQSIVERLDAAYLNLMDEMAEFQQHWDESPTVAMFTSANEGWNKGGADWLQDQAELFEKKLWIDLGGKIKEAAGNGYDRLASYSKQRYEDLKNKLNKDIESPEDTFYNWAWWQKSIEDSANELYVQQIGRLESLGNKIADAKKTVLETVDKARKIYKHRDAILNLPTLIANGEPRPIQAFVDNELMDIDPELAKAIKGDPHFAIVLEIIADNESALTYLSYAGLMIEAIPPNFYAYVAGKGAAYLMIEVVMLIITALLSAGAAVAARIGLFLARLAETSAKAASIGKKYAVPKLPSKLSCG